MHGYGGHCYWLTFLTWKRGGLEAGLSTSMGAFSVMVDWLS